METISTGLLEHGVLGLICLIELIGLIKLHQLRETDAREHKQVVAQLMERLIGKTEKYSEKVTDLAAKQTDTVGRLVERLEDRVGKRSRHGSENS